jgi:hypothetical protein
LFGEIHHFASASLFYLDYFCIASPPILLIVLSPKYLSERFGKTLRVTSIVPKIKQQWLQKALSDLTPDENPEGLGLEIDFSNSYYGLSKCVFLP